MSIDENLTEQTDDASDDATLLALRRRVRRISLGVLKQFKVIALMNQELGRRPGVFYCAICNAESGSPWIRATGVSTRPREKSGGSFFAKAGTTGGTSMRSFDHLLIKRAPTEAGANLLIFASARLHVAPVATALRKILGAPN
jgi:hypothetical protein